MCVLNRFSHVRLFESLWTVAYHTPLSMGFSRQDYWSGLSSPPQGDLPNPGIKPTSLMSPALASRFFTTHNKLWKFLKRWEHQTTLPASWEVCMQVKKQQLEPDMDQRTDSKLEKKCDKAGYCHPAYLTSMQSTSWDTLGWMKLKLESRLMWEISITSDKQMTPP